MFLYIYGTKQKPPPMFAKGQIIEIFFKLDEFWKKFSRFSPKCIEQPGRKRDTTLLTTDVSSISTSTKCVAI